MKESNEYINNLLFDIFKNKICKVCKSIEKSEDSSDGNVYIVECVDKKYVVKIYDDEKHFKSMINIHIKLLKNNVNVPDIVYSLNDKENGICIVIYSFIEGRQIKNTLKEGKVEENLITCIAKIIRKMHDIMGGNNDFNLPELKFDTYKKRRTMLHFDLTKDNIFLDNKNNISIIDFDDAKYGSAVYDVAILIATFFFSKSRGIDFYGMQKFITEYYGNDTDLKEMEEKLIKTCAIEWIDYLLNNEKLLPSLIDSFNIKKKLISEFDVKEN